MRNNEQRVNHKLSALMRQENQRSNTLFLPHHLVTFSKFRLVFVDIALEIFRESNVKNFGIKEEKFHERNTFTTKRKRREKQAAEIIITLVSSFAAAAAVPAVLLQANSIALLRDANRPSVVLRI